MSNPLPPTPTHVSLPPEATADCALFSKDDRKLAAEVEAHLRNATNPIPLFAKTGILSTVVGISPRIACMDLCVFPRSDGRFVLKATYDGQSQITVYDVAEALKRQGVGVKGDDIRIWTSSLTGPTPASAGSGGEIDDLKKITRLDVVVWLDRAQLVQFHPNVSDVPNKRDKFHGLLATCAFVSGVTHLAVPSAFPNPVVTGLNCLETIRDIAFGAFITFTALRALDEIPRLFKARDEAIPPL
jgi:hypothetical protein